MPRDDEDDRDRLYRLSDEDEGPLPPAPRPRGARTPDDGVDLRPLRRRPRKPSPSIPAMDNRVRLALFGVALLLVLLGLGAFGAWYLYRTTQAAPFQASMPAYLAPPVGAAPPGRRGIQGRMIVVDTAKKDVDWDAFFSLPDDLRASKPQEVGTIVWTSWGKDQVDSYENDAPAYVQTCQVTVIDRKSRSVLQQQTFRGTEPPQSIDSSSSSGSGSKPTQNVVNFLTGLPRG